ncbi:N-terminal domain of NEFA-interacting nuclear protein NIP30-domain-containing protein, partial [Phakopsora pachyrhizi]
VCFTQVGSRFVSSSDLESARLKREEEWRATYQRLGQEAPPMPKEEYDGRSLYEKLKETKDRKQEAFEEQLKFKNQFRPLDYEEVAFLDDAAEAKRREEMEKEERIKQEMEQFKRAVASRVAEPPQIVGTIISKVTSNPIKKPLQQTDSTQPSDPTKKSLTTSSLPKRSKRSKDFQSSFLAGAIRPRSNNTSSTIEPGKKRRKPSSEAKSSTALEDDSIDQIPQSSKDKTCQSK